MNGYQPNSFQNPYGQNPHGQQPYNPYGPGPGPPRKSSNGPTIAIVVAVLALGGLCLMPIAGFFVFGMVSYNAAKQRQREAMERALNDVQQYESGQSIADRLREDHERMIQEQQEAMQARQREMQEHVQQIQEERQRQHEEMMRGIREDMQQRAPIRPPGF